MIFQLRFMRCAALLAVAAVGCIASNLLADGTITGTVLRSEKVTSVVAVNRADGQKYTGSVDAKTGALTIVGLPLDATYDCIIDFDGARLEGINLHVPPSDYVEEQPLSEEDIETIRAKVVRMNKFEDVVDVKTIQGNIQHAAILISKLRTKPFFGSKPGELIWRAELWHFERPEETWVKVQDELFVVLYRERIQQSVYVKKSHTFDPLLGGLTLTSDQSKLELGDVEPPIAKTGIHFRNPDNESKAGLEPARPDNQ